MLERPNCDNQKRSIQECTNWHQKRIGSGVCDLHQDIGIRCENQLIENERQNFWRGIHFLNADSHIESIMFNKREIRVSDSILNHVIIEYAGRDQNGLGHSALQSTGSQPPQIDGLAIYRSASTALNITDPVDGFEVINSKFIENRAYGIYINSSVGRVQLSSIEVEDNGADGVHFVHFDKPHYSSDNFCETPNLGTSQVFPIKFTHRQSASKAPSEECCQEFYPRDWEGQRITVHFPLLMSGIEDFESMSQFLKQPYQPRVGREGSIYVVDGYSGRVIADFFIRNHTKIQSVSSIIGNGPLRVCYRPAHFRRILFTVQVVVDYGREYDVSIINSRLVANNGRGLWLRNLRSGAVINRTLIASHDYVSGIHIDQGVGEIIINNSVITNNLVDGINITSGGGFLHIDRTEIVNNTGNGIAVWFNESINLQAFNYSSHITRSALTKNRKGLLISSGCHFSDSNLKQQPFWNISLNQFQDQHEQALLYHSCVPRPRILKMQMKPSISNISISHNRFKANKLHAIHMAPIFFVKLSIAHNEFTQHPRAVLYINSQDSFNVPNFVEDAERFPFSFFLHKSQSFTNQRRLALDLWPVVVRIRNNNFHHNQGYYVASVGLLERESSEPINYSSIAQKVLFTRNILHENAVSEPFQSLNPRSRVSAVLCVTSSNVLVWRNEFINPESKYELGIHLSSHYRLINASLNYWGTMNTMNGELQTNAKTIHAAEEIYERIFDRKNRYNLAQVEFLPYILIPNALESDRAALSLVNDREKIFQFFHGISSKEIGGQVKGQVNLPVGKYFVKRDIYISPEGELVLNPGTVLFFDQSVGVFVQGKFKAKGSVNSDIQFLLASSKNFDSNRMKRSNNDSDPPAIESSAVQSSSSTNNQNDEQSIKYELRQINPIFSSDDLGHNIRLSNGTSGRLEIRLDNEWGSVCGYNFDIDDAAVACHQLGFVLNEFDWRLERSEFWSPANSRTILMTNVQCTHLDTDLTKCKAERLNRNDFEGNWCPKGEVGIRCYPQAWAGIRFGMLTQEVVIEHVTVANAGLRDYRTKDFGPALQFDFNRFAIYDSIIKSNIGSGIGVLWNDVISESNSDGLKVKNSKIIENLNHGIETRTVGMRIENCLLSDNKVSGFFYEPNFGREQQEELASWIVKQPIHNRKSSVFIITPGETPTNQSIYLGDIGRQIYVYIPRRPNQSDRLFHLLIRTDPGKRIGVMVLSPIFLTRSSENLCLFSPQIDNLHASKMMWDLRQNLTSFPFVYPGYRLMLEYSTGQFPYGGILLILQEQRIMNTITLSDNEIVGNGKGIISSHCSMNIDLNGNYCKRYGNVTILIENNLIAKSKTAGLFVNSFSHSSTIPYSLLMNLIEFDEQRKNSFDQNSVESIISEINYTLIDNRFVENEDFGSIVLYDHSLYANGDLQRSNVQSMSGFIISSAIGANNPSNTNLFHWLIRNSSLESNKNGGIDIRLPYNWLYNENFTHSVVIERSTFNKNQNFELVIGGHYARMNFTENRLTENQCKIGLLSIRGMEKLIRIADNEILENQIQKYVLEIDMTSHADKFGWVEALIQRNIIRNNRFARGTIQESLNAMNEITSSYKPETYAISVKGLQQVNITRNILVNRNLQFELMAGVKAGSLQNELSARENFWGVSDDLQSIRDRIFDFDDWNSFSPTIFSPWLSTDRIDSTLVYDRKVFNEYDSFNTPRKLGGRLTESLVLYDRENPYVVSTDLTVMPGATLTLRPGVIMEFYPSVGILVLGDLNALGSQDRPIIFRPINKNYTQQMKDFNYDFNYKANQYRKRQVPQTEQLVFSKSDHGGVRLCLTENCDFDSESKANEETEKILGPSELSGYPKMIDGRKRHGFLEIYNTTTFQWVPICDSRFTERNAQVVCRQLGFSSLNVFVRRGSRPDMDPTLVSRITEWPEPLECLGSESNLADCDQRTFSKDSYNRQQALYENAPLFHSRLMSSDFYRKVHYSYIVSNRTQERLFYLNEDWKMLEEWSMIQSTTCKHDGNEFVYIFCGEDNNLYTDESNDDDNNWKKSMKNFEHWGGIRFALPEFEDEDSTFSLNPTKRFSSSSTMQNVEIFGAGILHGEKNAAIQMIQRSVSLEFVNVHQSAYHAIESIAPSESLQLHRLKLEHNLGAGLNLFLLGISTSESKRVPYEPITDGSSFNVPYNAFSLVDICDARKQLRVKEKIYVFYKYDNRPVDCVKIFTSDNPLKLIGVRFLQLNLWSQFVESEGKVNTFENDYVEGRKFAFNSEDIFHNKLDDLNDNQMNSFVDASLINSMSDSILIWDGDIFNETTRRMIGEVYSDSTNEFIRNGPLFISNHDQTRSSRSFSRHRRYAGSSTRNPPLKNQRSESSQKNILYKSSGFSLSLQLHVSGASSKYGFIAEVTTLPSAYFDERNIQHNITFSEVNDNTAGAVILQSVGESIPRIALLNNLFKRNCRILWANFTTCHGNSLDLNIQNSPQLYFQNNLIADNRAGGVRIEATSFTAVSALNAYLINNLFANNLQNEALYFEGANSYQSVNVDRNYFSRNRSPYRSNIAFGRAIVKFHDNVVINNFGDSQLFVAGFAHAQSSSKLQRCTNNFFYNNRASNQRGERSTIIVSTIGQIFTDNYLVNPDNDFEMCTRNRTIVAAASYQLKQNTIAPTSYAAILASAIVQAPNNWWGFNETSAIEGRIRDSKDSYHLIPVQFQPFYSGNWSVLSGSCYGGYRKIADTCFVYIGGRMTYDQAKKFCALDNSSMPFVRAANQDYITNYIYSQKSSYDPRRHAVWVQSFDVPIGTCSVLIRGSVRVHDCDDELPFLCERDPEIGINTMTLDYWYQEPMGMAAIGISCLTILLTLSCICCWIFKSRHRHLEKLERRNSIRASIRSSRSLVSMSVLNDSNYFLNNNTTSRKLLPDNLSHSNVFVDGNPMYRSAPQINGLMRNPYDSKSKHSLNHSIDNSLSSAFSVFTDGVPDERLVLAQKNYEYAVKGRFANSIRPTTLPIEPRFDLIYDNRGFKDQSTPISPLSFSSREEHNPMLMRNWSPETNSTMDFKVKPALDPNELSTCYGSAEDFQKSIPSTTESINDSEQSSPSSVLSKVMMDNSNRFNQMKPSTSLMSSMHAPQLPPVRRLIQAKGQNRSIQQRRSVDPNVFAKELDEDNLHRPKSYETHFDSELMTFISDRPPKIEHKRPTFVTDLDQDLPQTASINQQPIFEDSQPSLMLRSSVTPSIPESNQSTVNPSYLETSLDNGSFTNENFKSAIDLNHSRSPIETALDDDVQHYYSQPLETSM
ncbi:Protein bark beetle [Sarcoptes scabiei]|uniref:Protein bark beetle n=1 Tax=Sarcoptes scabiei TaxID=52283 RepID=A0A834QZY8_SARSC|nr:Protein bark beetle [Sarcoptes scabiei]